MGDNVLQQELYVEVWDCYRNHLDLKCHGGAFLFSILGFLLIEFVALRFFDFRRKIPHPDSISTEAAYALECVYSITLEYERDDLNTIASNYSIPKADLSKFLATLHNDYKRMEEICGNLALVAMFALTIFAIIPNISSCFKVCEYSAMSETSLFSMYGMCLLGNVIAFYLPNVRMGGVTRRRLWW
eukprot:m.21218 g.21218  ORF g.21218 m.21218 type:complete len:186 (-) comp8693_c0_seq1:51-608(-)